VCPALEVTDDDLEVRMLLRANAELNWISGHYGEILKKFENQFIAVSGTNIVANGSSIDNLLSKLNAEGIDIKSVTTEYITKLVRIL